MMENLVDTYLSEKNIKLYNEISSKYKISLNYYEAPYNDGFSPWQSIINRETKEVLLRFYEKVATTGYFTHELFHVDLVDKGLYTMDELLLDPMIKSLGKYNINAFNNIIAHPKFYNEFINLQYLPSEFFCDFNKNYDKLIYTNFLQIEEAFSSKKYSDEGINSYLIIFFIAIFNKNEKYQFKLSTDLNYLSAKDHELFVIIYSHWNKWVHSASYDNLNFFKLLFTDIKAWQIKRQI